MRSRSVPPGFVPIFAIVFLALVSFSTRAQLAADTSRETRELAARVERLTLQKQSLQLQQDILGLSLPKQNVQALEGKLTLDDKVPPEAIVLLYRELREAVGEVAADLRAFRRDSAYVLLQPKDLDDLVAFSSLDQYTRFLNEQAKTLLAEAVPDTDVRFLPMFSLGAPFQFAEGMLQGFASIAQLLRTDHDYGSFDAQVDDAALAMLAHELGRGALTRPDWLAPSTELSEPTGLLSGLRDLEARRFRLDRFAASTPKATPSQAVVEARRKAAQELAATIQVFLSDNFVIDKTTSQNRLVRMLRAEVLSKAWRNGKAANALIFKVDFAHARSLKKKSLFRQSLSFAGQVSIRYMVMDRNGRIQESGVVLKTSPSYKRAQSIISESR